MHSAETHLRQVRQAAAAKFSIAFCRILRIATSSAWDLFLFRISRTSWTLLRPSDSVSVMPSPCIPRRAAATSSSSAPSALWVKLRVRKSTLFIILTCTGHFTLGNFGRERTYGKKAGKCTVIKIQLYSSSRLSICPLRLS